MSGYEFDARLIPPSSFPSISSFYLAGVDEAGRGPLAGPVIAAAVILPREPKIYGLRDSKVVPEEQRDALFCEIQDTALAYSIAEVSHEEIDRINIFQASMKAMRDAVAGLALKPNLVLVDGNKKPGTSFLEMAIIDGDAQSASIMAASILAKVTRDHIMKEEHEKYPQYGFDGHKGYGAPVHLDALLKYGPCPIHRRSFEPVRAALSPRSQSGGEECQTTTSATAGTARI